MRRGRGYRKNPFNVNFSFILDKGLAGAFFWSLELDDFSGKYCAMGKYPLVTAVHKELTLADEKEVVAVPGIKEQIARRVVVV